MNPHHVNVKFVTGVGVAVHAAAECSCGWTQDCLTGAQAREAGDRHMSQFQLGVAEVDCFLCGDHLPVRSATVIHDPDNMGTNYLCDDCANMALHPPEPPPAEELRDDLIALERELRV